jgi:putative SOS response-associated peptidase YedK
MTPAGLEAIEVRPIRPDVGNVRNNGPELITPMDEERAAATLF